MRDRHEPRSEFVEQLESQIGLEVRRRNRAVSAAPRWVLWSPMKATLAVVCLMLVSMGVGAGVAVVAYEAQGSEAREQLLRSFEPRLVLARQRVELATEQLQTNEQRVSVGLTSSVDSLESRARVAEAKAELKAIELQIEEIRLTAREPRGEISAPRVAGRDFVGERLRSDLSAVEAVLMVERLRSRETETRFQVGMATAIDVETSKVGRLELEAALEMSQKKIEIRQQFLTGLISPVGAELRALEAEADQRRKALVPKVELARKEADQMAARFHVGTVESVEVMKTSIRRLDLETQMKKADLELALVRRRIEESRTGK